jgi:hypothetical protein
LSCVGKDYSFCATVSTWSGQKGLLLLPELKSTFVVLVEVLKSGGSVEVNFSLIYRIVGWRLGSLGKTFFKEVSCTKDGISGSVYCTVTDRICVAEACEERQKK